MNDSTRRILRGLVQLVAGGGLGVLVTQVVLDTPNAYDPYVILAGAGAATIAQVVMEEWKGDKFSPIKREDPPVQ